MSFPSKRGAIETHSYECDLQDLDYSIDLAFLLARVSSYHSQRGMKVKRRTPYLLLFVFYTISPLFQSYLLSQNKMQWSLTGG